MSTIQREELPDVIRHATRPTPEGSNRSVAVTLEPPLRHWPGRVSKFARAPLRPGTVERERLLRRLSTESATPICLISAPAGYGKSTLASQWSERSERPVAWVNLDPSDNDPAVLLSAIVQALDRVYPVASDVLSSLSTRKPRLVDVVLPSLALELERLSPVDLILDDVHELTDPGSLEMLDRLLDIVGPQNRVMLLTRTYRHLSLARRRLAGNLVEIGARDLAFDPAEIGALAATRGMTMPVDALGVLRDRTRGWPAGIALSLPALDPSATPADVTRTITGDLREISQYFLEVCLDEVTDERRRFLLATSVLSELTPELCDAVVGVTSSALTLAELDAASSFVVALDGQRRRYEYHPLFAELLRSELRRFDPDLEREALSRGAAWYEHDGGNPGEAFRLASECSDFAAAGRVALGAVNEFARRGRLDVLRGWLSDCRDEQIEADPQLALAAAWVHLLLGDAEEANRYGAAAAKGDPEVPSSDGARSFGSARASFRTALAANGIGQMLTDADLACGEERDATTACYLRGRLAAGTARLLVGQPGQAVRELRESVTLTRDRPSLVHLQIQGLGYLSFAAGETGDWSTARRTAKEAAALSAEAGLDHSLPGVIALTARACVLARDGESDRAEAALAGARRLGHVVRGSRWMRADVNIRWGNTSLDLGDRIAAREHVDDARAALSGYGDPGLLSARLDELEWRLDSLADLHITPAEIRVLPFLPTHLSIKEIAARLYVSPATVKTHVSSIYAKLEAATRSEAIIRMEVLGLHHAGKGVEHEARLPRCTHPC